MGILSSTVSLSKYRVETEEIESNLIELVKKSLTEFSFKEVTGSEEISVGWVNTNTPFDPKISDDFLIGSIFVFSIRIDTRKVPGEVLKKEMTLEIDRTLKESGREFIAKSHKQRIKETILDRLIQQIPSKPNVYDIIWDYGDKELYFYSSHKVVNEMFFDLFVKTFNLLPIKLFPYTTADLTHGLNELQKRRLYNIEPISTFGEFS